MNFSHFSHRHYCHICNNIPVNPSILRVTFIWVIKKNRISNDRVQNTSRYTEILLYSFRFRSNCRHFSRFDFHACRASISKVNRQHTPRAFPFSIFFYSPAGGIEDICMYSAWLHTGGLPIFPQYRDTANCCPASLFSSCKCVHVGSSCTHVPCDFTGYRPVEPMTCKVDSYARYDISLLFFLLLLAFVSLTFAAD